MRIYPPSGQTGHYLHRRHQERCFRWQKVLYYEIVIRHLKSGNPPLAVAKYFATSRNIPSIWYFINLFCRVESFLYRSKRTLPKLVICDISIALIPSIVLSFFKETLKSSLDRSYPTALRGTFAYLKRYIIVQAKQITLRHKTEPNVIFLQI